MCVIAMDVLVCSCSRPFKEPVICRCMTRSNGRLSPSNVVTGSMTGATEAVATLVPASDRTNHLAVSTDNEMCMVIRIEKLASL